MLAMDPRRLSLSVPKDRAQFIENYFKAAEDEIESEVEATSPVVDGIQNYIDFPKSLLLTTGGNAQQMFSRPPRSSRDARNVWKQAKLPKSAPLITIERKLLDWAFVYAILEIKDKRIESITWRGSAVCRASWAAFLRWMTCAGGTQAL